MHTAADALPALDTGYVGGCARTPTANEGGGPAYMWGHLLKTGAGAKAYYLASVPITSSDFTALPAAMSSLPPSAIELMDRVT